jgi:hypothetical protein
MRKLLLPLLAALIAAAITTGLALGGRSGDGRDTDHKSFGYAIGLWGDLPYSTVQEAALPNLFADMNREDLAFTANDGDLKQGSGSPCDDALYTRALGWFRSLESAAIFTPGDNDWTDCDRASNGGFNSLERLDHERRILFGTRYSLGRHPLRQEVQTESLCLGLNGTTEVNVPCVENRRWSVRGVTYATLNIQGSCNNLCDTNPDPAEQAARNAANIAWLQQTFAQAKQRRSAAVMLITQADPGFTTIAAVGEPTRDPKTLQETDAFPDGYQSFLVELRRQVIDFGRPVAYVHGDSHYFRIDKPLLDSAGARVENFTRVETFGDHQENGTNDVNWLKVLVDPGSREVFAFQTQIVPANKVVHPASG